MNEVSTGAQSAQSNEKPLNTAISALDEIKQERDKNAMHTIIGEIYRQVQKEQSENV